MSTYRISGNQDGLDYGTFQADSEEQAIENMLQEAGVEEMETDNFTAKKIVIQYLRSHMHHGVNVDWFDIDGTTYGLNSRKGITDRYGWEIENVPVEVATAILKLKATI